ncbi:hypothetical protein ACIRP7_37005 [Streptomyces sp. NPDC102270]|uniref:hypothetical protein n=1 Tax=Streptomyces sp. NPDC102270 TaxID=3366150 RepID=UPI003809ED6C
MEPIAVGAVVALIADYAAQVAGGAVDSYVTDRLRRLWDAVAARFRGDPAAEGALDRLREQPENSRRQGTVEDYLEEMVGNDREFASTLAQLLREFDQSGDAAHMTRVENAGAVAMGQGRVDISGSFAGGRDINLHGPVPAVAPPWEQQDQSTRSASSENG